MFENEPTHLFFTPGVRDTSFYQHRKAVAIFKRKILRLRFLKGTARSRGAKIDGVGISVRTRGAVCIPDPHVAVIYAENIVQVRSTAQPPIIGLIRCSVVAAIDVFSPPAPTVAGELHALPGGRAVRAGMIDEIIERHIRAVGARRIHQRTVDRQRVQTVGEAGLIDQIDDLVFVTAVVDDTATCPGGGRGKGQAWRGGVCGCPGFRKSRSD